MYIYTRVLGPKYYNIYGIWALKPYILVLGLLGLPLIGGHTCFLETFLNLSYTFHTSGKAWGKVWESVIYVRVSGPV